MANQNMKALVLEAMAVVYTDEQKFINVLAKEFALSNLGQELEDHIRFSKCAPEHVIDHAWSGMLSECDSDEMEEGMHDERRGWEKDAKKMLKQLKSKKLPLTIANAHLAWEIKGPFAKQVKEVPVQDKITK